VTDNARRRELKTWLKRLQVALKNENLFWPVVRHRLLELLRLLERVEGVEEIEPVVMRLIKAVRFRNPAVATLALEEIEKWVRHRDAFFGLTFTASDSRADEVLPVRFSQAYYLADTSHWRTAPPKPNDDLEIYEVKRALLVDLELRERWSRFVVKFKAKRIGGNIIIAHHLPVAVARVKYDSNTLSHLLENRGFTLASDWRCHGATYYAIILPIEFLKAYVPLFECDFRGCVKLD